MTTDQRPVFLLSQRISFPPPRFAREDGLLAVGGDLRLKRVLLAYRMGIFPWYSPNEPILWWSPDPRMVLYPDEIRVSKRLRRTIRQGVFELTMDRSFREVMTECGRVREEVGEGTWITEEMLEAYCGLHDAGYAHSVEAWQDGKLAGGLYGLSLGKSFFGESMFARVSNASKVAFVTLVEHLKERSFEFVDCQVHTSHLESLGAREIPRARFLKELEASLKKPTMRGRWSFGS